MQLRKEEKTYFAKMSRCVLDVCGRISRDILTQQMPLEFLRQNVNCMNIPKDQKQILKRAPSHGNYDECDVPLIYTVLRNYCTSGKLPMPTNGWGQPVAGTNVSDDIERIRMFRNDVFAHSTSASMTKNDFEDHFQILREICLRMDTIHNEFLVKSGSISYLEELKEIKADSMESSTRETYITEIRKLYKQNEERNKELAEKVHLLENKVENIKYSTEDDLQKPRILRGKSCYPLVK